MFIIDFDDTLFDTHALKAALVRSPRGLDASELKELLFPDAPLFLHYLKTNGQKLILLSRGETEFQNKKIDAAGIAEFFDEIIITSDDKESALKKVLAGFKSEEHVWFINDKIEETKKVIEHWPYLKPILKISPRWPEDEYELSLMPYFSSLIQIQQYVEQKLK